VLVQKDAAVLVKIGCLVGDAQPQGAQGWPGW